MGSSPLTRGKPGFAAGAPDGGGLIPAHAGKTWRTTTRQGTSRAHPRSRGENLRRCLRVQPVGGSSPLTRGKRERSVQAASRWRLIPAHAGKTHPRARRSGHRTAHPRSRGENSTPVVASWKRVGSSPLTRGKPAQGGGGPQQIRLIPAHAGKTNRWSNRPRTTGAHPRSRGENAPVT